MVWMGTGVAQQSKVPPEIWQKAQEKGTVHVIVQLNVPWQPEGKLSKEDAVAQRKAGSATRVYQPALLQSEPLIGGDQAWTNGFDGTGHAVVTVI